MSWIFLVFWNKKKKKDQNGSLFLSGEQNGLTGIAPPKPPQIAGKCLIKWWKWWIKGPVTCASSQGYWAMKCVSTFTRAENTKYWLSWSKKLSNPGS